jgi:hypothetical protein
MFTRSYTTKSRDNYYPLTVNNGGRVPRAPIFNGHLDLHHGHYRWQTLVILAVVLSVVAVWPY